MKNLIITACLFVAMSVNAQSAKATQPVSSTAASATVTKLGKEASAAKDAADLAAFIPMSTESQEIFTGLFRTKYETLHENGELSDERKQIVYKTIERKLEATLQGPDFTKLKANTALFNQLTR